MLSWALSKSTNSESLPSHALGSQAVEVPIKDGLLRREPLTTLLAYARSVCLLFRNDSRVEALAFVLEAAFSIKD